MASEDYRLTADSLAQRVGEDADAARVAEGVVVACREIEASLSPVIGPRGFTALYRRSLYLTGSAPNGLEGLHEDAQASVDFEALRAALAQQGSADAAAAGAALLQSLRDVLTGMVGPSLCERLLHSVSIIPSSGSPEQDIRP